MTLPMGYDRHRLWWLLLLFFFRTAFAHAAHITSISISPGQPTVSIGSETQLTATAIYSDGSRTNVTRLASWQSQQVRTVQISTTGLASGLATGTVPITATYEGVSRTAAITSSMGTIDWSGPITITKGGTYSGKWRSTHPGTAAVTVATTAPVLIENSYVMSPGNLINDVAQGSSVVIRNVVGIGVNPNVRGLGMGIFVDAFSPALLTVENCYWEDVQFGVRVEGYKGNRNGTQTITIKNNRGRNILGVKSNGQGGYLPGSLYYQWAHAIQISDAAFVPGVVIAWNELINYPYQSLVNEVISMYDAGGTASSPALIHDNYIQGAYAWNPPVDYYNGGGITTDGSAGDTVQTASAFNDIYENQVIDTVNMSLELGSGHDNRIHDNKSLSAGVLPNGTRIAAQNVGLTIYDNYDNTKRGSMYNNNFYNNTTGWMCWAQRCAWNGHRSDAYFETNGADYGLNISIAANPITLAMQYNEYNVWLQKISSGHQSIGPRFSSDGSGGGGGEPGPAPSTTSWYTIVNTNSSLCLAVAANSSDGVRMHQDICRTGEANQQWQFKVTGEGYYQVVNRGMLNRTSKDHSWNVSGGPWEKTPGAKVQLWTYGGATNQQWLPVYLGNEHWKFVVRSSNGCLDVPGATLDALAVLQQFACNGGVAQSYLLNKQ